MEKRRGGEEDSDNNNKRGETSVEALQWPYPVLPKEVLQPQTLVGHEMPLCKGSTGSYLQNQP